ncbi:ATP-binding cassette domain-containing protein [Streptacidiphilus sp. PB12-B1b]|uniref:ATP-binding cassette domain-containing protein n=1 Tax=Streptacidiphilus sp. PB12-B1b TaxID=2705012 RepID=UPI0015FBCCE2|nr:ATP-binding cassette domain-containing protein [Streptacidiphilus sp. PB12-B1b]QMU77849.1 ATP-binding cassette domain-containing protein [Streptacidiphilus sp. PB12-B1b]
MAVEIALCAARVRYGPLEALHGVDLRIPSARITVLLGRNGAGRSTALHALAGSQPLSAGRVRWFGGAAAGRDITALDAFRRARLGMALVPAERAVFPSLSAAEHLSRLAPPARGAALELFPELRRLLERRAGTLSGGEQQLLALAVALAGPHRLLLLDELGRGLAAPVLARVHAALAAAVAAGRTVVLAEQRLPPGLATDLVYVLHRGSVAFVGEPGEPAAELRNLT